uniref:TFIIS-type domain-containing protein n=1 Tax=Chaetoceros debilis TaxID=122233 RepID=A0A7S3V5P0_9STRA|mmetsp:Transcript_13667/g.20343  ORF Transcript_13667/g.20343 Transcript_13667/m.20343 type:complete len:163 (+) Transcript_13667:137-625(+)
MEIDNAWNQEEETFDVNDVGNYGAENHEDILDLDNVPSHSGAPTTSRDGVLLMRFCPHDSSMLYPKEHKSSRSLQYACRLCSYSEVSNNPMIYKNVLKKEVKNVLHTVPGAISDDPTLPRSQNQSCENCGHHEAVFFQSDTGQSDSLALIMVCCNCEHRWVK